MSLYINAKLVWTIKCQHCEKEYTETFETDWFRGWQCGKLGEESLSGDETIDNARMENWTFDKISYEELNPNCPNCKFD